MTNKTVNQAIEILQDSLSKFWQRDPEQCLKCFAEDIILVGSLQEQFVRGIDNAAEILHQTVLQMPMCHLMEQEFIVAQNCGASCTIVGRYLTTTDNTEDYFVQSQQRCTAVWELIKGELKIRHLHISDPMGQLKLKEGELFANTMGKMATEYYLRKARSLNDSRRIVVKGRSNVVQFLSYAEIMYVSAMGRDIEIYTDGGKTIIAQTSISDFMKETNSAFISIHRSYAVNPMYVSRIQQFEVILTDGTSLPIESRDESTGGHINRTSDVVRIFSKYLLENEDTYHMSKQFLDMVTRAAPMHDLGKIAVDDKVLRKQAKYTDDEYNEMKKHAEEGGKIAEKILRGVEADAFVDIVSNVAHYHHEKWDGTGYPQGLSKEEIPIEARIMALADVFDALVSKRCYKDAYSYDKSFSIIEESLGKHFDPELGKAFIMCRDSLEQLYNSNL